MKKLRIFGISFGWVVTRRRWCALLVADLCIMH